MKNHISGKKRILLIGGGYASCCAARLLTDLGHEAVIFEGSNQLGGMARSFYLDGLSYEFGPHILANHACDQSVIDFILRFIDVKKTSMDTASYVEGKYLSYPPNIDDVPKLKEVEVIQKELLSLPSQVNESNFETYLISKVGLTLYSLYYKGFTEKFWGVHPNKLHSDWAKLRHLGENLTDKKMFFNKHWCTYPVHDYNELFERIVVGIEVLFNTKIQHIDIKRAEITDQRGHHWSGDFIVNTASLDRIFGEKFGTLKYSGYDITPVIVKHSYFHPKNIATGDHYSMVYYPEKSVSYTRITEYKNFNNKKTNTIWKNRTIISIETPSNNVKFYPFMDGENEERLKKYLKYLAKYPKLVSLGRLGLYKYTTLDTTTAQVMRFINVFNSWQVMSEKERFSAYGIIRGSWDN
jgi:UDP-galactopyranose mutase